MSPQNTNAPNLIGRKDGMRVPLSMAHAALLGRVRDIVRAGPKEETSRIDAGGTVTPMKNTQAIWD